MWPAGPTKSGDAYEVVPQGSGGAALASGCDIAQGVDRYFAGSLDEVTYGAVRLQPLSYQDDICRLAGSSESARSGNVKLSGLMDEKGLRCHPDKTVLITMGTKKLFKEDINKKI